MAPARSDHLLRPEIWAMLNEVETERLKGLQELIDEYREAAEGWQERAEEAEATADTQAQMLKSLQRQIDLFAHMLTVHAETEELEEEEDTESDATPEPASDPETEVAAVDEDPPDPAALLEEMRKTLDRADRRVLAPAASRKGRRRKSLINRTGPKPRPTPELAYSPPAESDDG